MVQGGQITYKGKGSNVMLVKLMSEGTIKKWKGKGKYPIL